MNKSLLSYLSATHPVSGEELAAIFSCSRAAISKQIDGLKQAGVLITAKPKVGYQLAYEYRWWSGEEAATLADDLSLQVTRLDEVESTNTWLREHIPTNKPHLVLTDWQKSGRGRRERQWLSPPGRQFTFSLRQDSQQGPWPWRGLALAVGVMLAEALNTIGIPVRLKWPNDLWLDGAKLGGILVELAGASDGPSAVIIGVGINEFLTSSEQESLDRPVSDLHYYAKHYQRLDLLSDMVKRLCKLLREYPGQGIAPYLERWPSYDILRSQPVQYEQLGQAHHGIAQGLDSEGNLLVLTSGELVVCQASEVSLLPPASINK